MIRLCILDEKLDDLDLKITRYVNNNVKEVINVAIDFLEDDNDFDIWNIIPINTTSIDEGNWLRMVYDLFNMVKSQIVRDYIKPKYQYLLYMILDWWQECVSDETELLLVEIEEDLKQEIKKKYIDEDDGCELLRMITTYEEYLSILFEDQDFLPERLEAMITLYLRSREKFNAFFGDVDLEEYRDLMPNDLKEQYDENKKIKKKEELGENYVVPSERLQPRSNEERLNATLLSADSVLRDLLDVCESICNNKTYDYNQSENAVNDYFRDMLSAKGYAQIMDQTRHGVSNRGDDAGEVDILLKKNNREVAIIEGLKLDCVNQKYIKKHINKAIINYNALGTATFIIAYVGAINFKAFWEGIYSYLSSYNYPLKVRKRVETMPYPNAAVRYANGVLSKDGYDFPIYFIAVNIQQKRVNEE